MARRLAVLLTRSLATDTCKVFHRTFATACYGGHKVPVLARIPPITYQNYSTSVTESAQDVVEEPPGMFKRFWRWLSDSDDMDTEYKMSEEERQERDEVMVKVQEMYFANPPIEPNLEFYKEVIGMLIKYSDRRESAHAQDFEWKIMDSRRFDNHYGSYDRLGTGVVQQMCGTLNTWPGVDTLWNLMPEMKVEPDEELRSIVTTFMEESRDKD